MISAKIKKTVASQVVILLKTFPAFSPHSTELAALPPNVPDSPPPWLACINTTAIRKRLTTACIKIRNPIILFSPENFEQF